MLHDVLLRGARRTSRGGGRGTTYLAQLFDAWRRGDRLTLIRWLEADRARGWASARRRARVTRHVETDQERADRAARVLELISEGEISRAMALLHSMGVGGLTRGVLQQMARKHPERQRIVPAQMPIGAAQHACSVQLTDTFRGLRRRRGTGVSGLCNEYLRALVGTFDDAEADRVMPAYDAFATAAVNVAFPTWFYSAWAIAGLHPLVKAQLSPDQRAAGADPDCRPVAVGECTLRSIARQLTDEASPVAAEELRPQQVAVGVSGGLSIMIHGVRLLLEQHGDFVVVRLDMRNGYNAASRSVLLRRLSESPRLAHLAPFIHALSAGGTDLLLGSMRQRLFPEQQRADSSEGTQQGLPPSSLLFCVGIQPELRSLDAELTPYGGCARGDMDDIYAMGPARAVFPAVERFVTRLREMLNLEIQHSKSSCWSRHYDLAGCPWRARSGIPVGGVEIGGDGAGGGVAHGVIVGGVPIGEPAFVAEHMRREADEIVSYIQKTVTQLHDSPHALWAALYYSAQHKFDYWLRHMPPAEVGDAAARIDAAMIQAVEAVSYVGMCGDGYARRRVHLPARMRGCVMAAASARWRRSRRSPTARASSSRPRSCSTARWAWWQREAASSICSPPPSASVPLTSAATASRPTCRV